jgi:hypothetical protein
MGRRKQKQVKPFSTPTEWILIASAVAFLVGLWLHPPPPQVAIIILAVTLALIFGLVFIICLPCIAIGLVLLTPSLIVVLIIVTIVGPNVRPI